MSIIPYTFPETGTPVRTVTINGEPWFVGRDVAGLLGYANPSRDIARHTTETQRSLYRIGTPSGEQDAVVVSEAGVYRLVMRSNLPAAERFQDWLAEDVIPSIRRSGAYVAPAVLPPVQVLPDLTTPQGVLALAQQFTRTAEQLVEADAKLRELEPKALAHDAYLAAGAGDVLVRQAAKLLGWKERDLRTFLADEHLIYRRQAICGTTVWDFYAANAPHFTATETMVTHTWGDCAHYTLHITPRGMELLQARIVKRQAEMRNAIGGAA